MTTNDEYVTTTVEERIAMYDALMAGIDGPDAYDVATQAADAAFYERAVEIATRYPLTSDPNDIRRYCNAMQDALTARDAAYTAAHVADCEAAQIEPYA